MTLQAIKNEIRALDYEEIHELFNSFANSETLDEIQKIINKILKERKYTFEQEMINARKFVILSNDQ